MTFTSTSRLLLLSAALVLSPSPSAGFLLPSPATLGGGRTIALRAPRDTSSSSSSLAAAASGDVDDRHRHHQTRRGFVESSIAASLASALASPTAALAKDEAPVTRQAVAEAFAAVRSELASPAGVYSTLSNLIESGSFEEILQYTKESDAYFRKAKIGRARKMMTDKDLKGEALQLSNAVTFDLIGINRASRPGRENKEEQLRYLEELRKDVEKFLEFEGTVEVAD